MPTKLRFDAWRFLQVMAVFALITLPVQAQIARVGVTERSVEKRSGQNPWQNAKKGLTLAQNDALRTGKRSKADILFTDGSLIRLGQLSSLEISGARDATLSRGALLFSFLKPGRVLTGTAAAEIKGTVGVIRVEDDGTSEFTLYTGAMDVVTAKERITLQPGQSIRILAGGLFSALSKAAPFQYQSGDRSGGLSTSPEDHPYSGSEGQGSNRGSNSGPGGADDVLETALDTLGNEDRSGSNSGSGGGSGGGGADDPFGDDNSGHGGGTLALTTSKGLRNTRFAALQIAPAGAVENGGTVQDAERALQRLHSSNLDHGGTALGAEGGLVGAYGDGGVIAYGGSLRVFGARDKLFADVQYQPLRLSSRNAVGTRTTQDFSAISHASLLWRDGKKEIEAGRQHFLNGPVQATLFGSMVRAGGRNTMDAVRVSHPLSANQNIELAYLVDAYPRNLPFRVAGMQNGVYARYSTQREKANIGVNLLHYIKNINGINTKPGATVDFGLSLLNRKMELYGEAGRDPLKRTLTTIGITSPWLYDKTDWEVYLEYANLKASSLAGRTPTELALLAYRPLSKNATLLLSLRQFYGGGTTATIGIALGGKVSRNFE